VLIGRQGVEYLAEIAGEGRELIGGGGVQDVQVDGPVAVHYPVSQPGGLLPRDAGKSFLDVVGELGGCLAGLR
jgi:hypothetical protein